MKKSLLIAALALALVVLPGTSAFADSWTGRISDDHCGAGGAKDGHAACAKKCVDGGGKYVFVNSADKKVFAIDNQELAGQHLDTEVVVTGTVDGTSIKVEKIDNKS